MIKVAHLSKTFRHGLIKEKVIKAVDDVSFSIEGGQTLGLVGMSGCGKSTLSRMILKLISSDTGSITFKNINITDYSFKQMKPLRRDMQILFQHPDSSLNPRMIIGKSMLEPFKLNPDLNRSKASEAIEEQLLFVGLNPEVLSRYPHQISGGQIQRICLARLLLLKPSFIVLDEPTSMLDVSVQAQVMAVLKKAQHRDNIAYLLISHDLDLVRACSHEIAVMVDGKIIEKQKTDALYEHPKEQYTKNLLKAFSDF